jgi:hypothetical protein
MRLESTTILLCFLFSALFWALSVISWVIKLSWITVWNEEGKRRKGCRKLEDGLEGLGEGLKIWRIALRYAPMGNGKIPQRRLTKQYASLWSFLVKIKTFFWKWRYEPGHINEPCWKLFTDLICEKCYLMTCRIWGFYSGHCEDWLSSRMWPRMGLVRADVSEERISTRRQSSAYGLFCCSQLL